MITLQKEQLKQNSGRDFILSSLVVSFIFAAPFLNLILVLTGRENQSGQLALVYIVCTCGLFLYTIFNKIHFIKKNTLFFVFVPLVLFSCFLYTESIYGRTNAYFNSERRSVMAIWPATILIGMILQYKRCNKINMNVIFIVSLLLTLLAFYGVFFSNSQTTGGLQRDDSGLLYQNISYYAAYAIGMTGFIIRENRFKKKIYKILLLFLIVLQFIMCFISGGKGGVLLATILIIYFLFLKYKARIILLALPLAAAYLWLPHFIELVGMQFNLNMTGFNRILSFIDGSSVADTGRKLLWYKAFEMFKSAPIFGHGLGSTFYEMNSYSHNLFMDLLAETGVFGMLIFILGLVVFGIKVLQNYKMSELCRWLCIIFIAGFTMNLFSGYIWANHMVWIPMVVMAGMRPNKYE